MLAPAPNAVCENYIDGGESAFSGSNRTVSPKGPSSTSREGHAKADHPERCLEYIGVFDERPDQ
jgi:hypothetical protein